MWRNRNPWALLVELTIAKIRILLNLITRFTTVQSKAKQTFAGIDKLILRFIRYMEIQGTYSTQNYFETGR